MKKYAMSNDPQLIDYLDRTFNPEDTLLRTVRASASSAGIPPIHVGSFDGLHLEVLTRALGAAKIVEIGTLVGYSAICMARSLPAQGKIWSLEISQTHAAVARKNIQGCGFADRVEVIVGPALETLQALEKIGSFDLVFIDADKENYPAYLAWAERNLRIGGSVLADNTLAWGHIHETSIADSALAAQVSALQAFNRQAASSERLRSTLLPTGEGLTLSVKVK